MEIDLDAIIGRGGYVKMELTLPPSEGYITSATNLREDPAKYIANYRETPAIFVKNKCRDVDEELNQKFGLGHQLDMLILGKFPKDMTTKAILARGGATEKAYFVTYVTHAREQMYPERPAAHEVLLVCGENDYKTLREYVKEGHAADVAAALKNLFTTGIKFLPPKGLEVFTDYKVSAKKSSHM